MYVRTRIMICEDTALWKDSCLLQHGYKMLYIIKFTIAFTQTLLQ